MLRAEGAVRGEPETAPLAAQFDILNAMSSRRIGIVNARATEVNEWQYQLMPKSAGDFTIPPLRIGDRQSNAGQRARAGAGSTASAAADIFMELTAEPDVVYAQSQVLFTLRLYVGVSTGRATLTAPETTGVEAIVEKLGEDSNYQTTRGGRNFVVRERRYAIFPQQAGAADDRARDVRSDGDSRSRLLARAAFSFGRARARPCSRPSRRRRRSRARRGCRRSA